MSAELYFNMALPYPARPHSPYILNISTAWQYLGLRFCFSNSKSLSDSSSFVRDLQFLELHAQLLHILMLRVRGWELYCD